MSDCKKIKDFIKNKLTQSNYKNIKLKLIKKISLFLMSDCKKKNLLYGYLNLYHLFNSNNDRCGYHPRDDPA
jgi:hypothetical protein